MPKPKLSDFKKLLAEMTPEEMQAELLKLFNKLDQVQMFYAQDLLSKEDRQKILANTKAKIYGKYWNKTGSPRRVKNAQVREIINDFEKVWAFPNEVTDLLLYRVLVMTQWANYLGGASDTNYKAAITSFKKAMELIQKNRLEAYFKDSCMEIMYHYQNLDYWFIGELRRLYEEYLNNDN